MSNNTASIITLVKYEHDFINQWIEYHYKLGFGHFYIIIDNIVEEQPDYEIDHTFKDNVTLIKCNQDTIIKKFGYTVQEFNNKHGYRHISYFLHELLNTEIIYNNIIKEDWVTAVGLDQFIYLNGETIQHYLSNIHETCTQIFFPWSISAYNNQDMPYDNLMKNIHTYNCSYNKTTGHSNAMIRVSDLQAISSNSHSFISKNIYQKIYIIDEYYTAPKEILDIFSYFRIAEEKMNKLDLYSLKMSSFHIMLRNIDEIIIKNCLFWNMDNNNFNTLINDVQNKIYNLNTAINRQKLLVVNHDKTVNNYLCNLQIPDLNYLNTNNQYKKLYMNYITEEQLNMWKSILPYLYI